MGAFIRLRTLVSDRRQLLDVGIAGPIAGLAVAIRGLWRGLRLSRARPGHGPDAGMLVAMGTDTVAVGDSLLTLMLRHLVHGSAPAILLAPMAFAGWLGIVVTMYNLLPISQLDGGHVLYAALRTDRKSTRLNSSHGYISYAVFCLKKKKKNTTGDDERETPMCWKRHRVAQH